MKIGVLTYHAPCNFGANLQAYSSVRFFQSLGHEAKVINYLIEEDINPKNCSKEQASAHKHFSQDVLPVTRPVHNGKEIYEVVKEEGFNIVAIGADAVWNKRDRDRLAVFYASWLWGTDLENSVKVISLSPAFMGQSYTDLTPEERDGFKTALLKFTAINTRDIWTKDVVNREIIGCDYIKTTNPDPVFNLNEYCSGLEWIHPKGIKEKSYVIFSVGTNEQRNGNGIKSKMIRFWNNRLIKAAHKRGLSVVELPIPSGKSGLESDYLVDYPIDPLQWFLWIKNAKAFIGLRFHAVVSCISAGTPFFSLDVYGKVPGWYNCLLAVGLNPFDNRINKTSKIRNLLEGSGLEKYRFSGRHFYFINPVRLLNRLLKFNTSKIKDYKEKNVALFNKNMQEAIKKCQ